MSNASPLEADEARRLVEIDWRPSAPQLRTFGLAAFVALPLLGWLLIGRPASSGWTPRACTVVGVLLAVGGLMALGSLTRPLWLSPIYVAASLVAWPIGLVVGEVMLSAIYFALFTPLAFAFRLIRRDALELKLDRNAVSYWRAKRQTKAPDSYFRQS